VTQPDSIGLPAHEDKPEDQLVAPGVGSVSPLVTSPSESTINRPGMVSRLTSDPRTADGVLRGKLQLDKPRVPCEGWLDGCPTWALVSGSLVLKSCITSKFTLSRIMSKC
jgi:hypothetical protein